MIMEKTWNEIWHDWAIIRDDFTKTYGDYDSEFGCYYIPQKHLLYNHFINMGIEMVQVPLHIVEANLRVLGKVPCDKLLDGAVIELYKYSGHNLDLLKSKFAKGTPIKIVKN